MAITTTNLKRPEKGKEGSDRASSSDDYMPCPAYGYGLMIRLETFDLDKLKLGLPRVGQKVTIQATGYVDNVHESQSMENQGDRSVGIQITDLGLEIAK